MHDLNKKAEREVKEEAAMMRYLSRTCMLTPRPHHWIAEAGVVVDVDFTLFHPWISNDASCSRVCTR